MDPPPPPQQHQQQQPHSPLSPFRTPQKRFTEPVVSQSPFQYPANNNTNSPPGLYSPPTPGGSSTKPTSSLARKRRSSVLLSPGGPGGGMSGGGFPGQAGMQMGPNGQMVASAPNSPNGAFGGLGGFGGFGGMLHGDGGEGNVVSQAAAAAMEADPFDHISQAMTLLSLTPHTSSAPLHLPNQPQPSEQPQWPDTEELLKESLRQSLSALRALQAAKRYPQNLPAEKLRAVEAALVELRGAGQMLVWAEQQAEVERREVLEKGMKGGG